MAPSQRGLRYEAPVERSARRPEGRDAPIRRRGAWFRRGFVMLVVPVLLMLGSVYVHTVAAGLEGEAAGLADEKARAGDEGERLEVQITDLSEPGRIRELAKENLGMQDPGQDLTTYDERDGGSIVNGGGEKNQGAGK